MPWKSLNFQYYLKQKGKSNTTEIAVNSVVYVKVTFDFTGLSS